MRRRVGATAWAVLEQLIAHSHGPVERCAAVASVRSLAADLGVSKDTVARALSRLRDAELVTAEQSRASAGPFTTGSYRIDVPSCITVVELPAPTVVKPRPLASRASVAQRSLFDRDPASP